MTTFQTLPDDAKRLICIELYRENSNFIRPLWETCRAWRTVAETYVYRDLALSAVVTRNGIKKVQVNPFMESEFSRKYLEHTRYVST